MPVSRRHVLILLLLLSPCLAAQTRLPSRVDEGLYLTDEPQSLDLLLSAALTTPRQSLRPRLNHIGVVVQKDDGGWLVSAVLDGYPAHLAGLRRGDRLLSVDGEDYQPITSFNGPLALTDNEYSARIVPHQLVFQRNSDNLTTTITPVYENLYDSYRSATLNSRQEFSNGNKVIGYLHLWVLSANGNDLQSYRAVLDSLRHCDGLIIDVRNSTGFLTAEHLDFFFPSRRDYQKFSKSESYIPPQANYPYYDREMIVLRNDATRDGAELFARQLGSLPRVITVGQGSDTEQAVEYSLHESAVTDPQYEAGVMALMSIM